MTKYQCIECGKKVQKLYQEYKTGTIKMSHCEFCKEIADKYIEYDPVIIFLDALLLQRQAYRHILINTKFDSHWKLALLLCMCDAFIKLVIQRTALASQNSDSEPFNYVFIGLELYLNFIVAATELIMLLVSVLTTDALKNLWQHRNLKSMSTHQITKAVIIANMWHILAIPALLWGQVYSNLYLWLSHGFVCISTFQALRVVTQEDNHFWVAVCVGVGFAAQMLVSGFIDDLFVSGYLDKSMW
uniref:Protein ARV n=1 Tax=Arion vulgaris TaxID=1028688 RepID=A0A0B7AB26_9EUPU